MAEAWVTDVTNFYATVDPHRLLEFLSSVRCPLSTLKVLTTFLHEWASSGVPGLPIGPETSGVLGTAFLLPVDQRLQSERLGHLRYTDDIVVVGRELRGDELEGLVSETLEGLNLERSVAKTHHYSSTVAIQAVEDVLLSYLGRAPGARVSDEDLLHVLEGESEQDHPDVKRVRFAIRGLGARGVASGAPVVLAHASLLNCDPSVTCNYLRSAIRTPATRDTLLEFLVTSATEERQALRFHILRVMRDTSWGAAEGEMVMEIADDKSVPAITRAQAWMTATRTPAWGADDAMDAAAAERHPVVRRGVVLTLRTAHSTKSKTSFLRKMRQDPYVAAAAEFAAA